METLIDDCGLTRARDRLAWDDTVAASTKAALLELRRPATIQDLRNMTGHSDHATRAAVTRSTSMDLVTKGVPHHGGLVAESTRALRHAVVPIAAV